MSAGKKILVLTDWYEPGYKAGGPIRSCVNFVNHMRDDYTIYVFTSDRDLGDPGPYENIKTNSWFSKDGKVYRYYGSPDRLNWQNIRGQLKAIQPDFIYLNSMFSLNFTIYPLLISRLYKLDARVVLSPRGMLRESAIRFKTAKKMLFLKGLRLLGIHRHLRFHATDATEVSDIRRYFGPASQVSLIPNFPGAVQEDSLIPGKERGKLSMIFVGRIHPIKNLDYLLTVLKEVKSSEILLTIVGSLEDPVYWEKCKKIIAELPSGITIEYAGEIANHELPAITARHHVFALPTQGENFGHAIFEALALGKPVLISDQTPWRNLAVSQAGWDLPLDRPELFRESIEKVAGFGQEEYNKWSLSTFKYIQDFIAQLTLKEDYLKLFDEVPEN
jgi:glycosyltransferase involved in cell wall biosynthesis